MAEPTMKYTTGTITDNNVKAVPMKSTITRYESPKDRTVFNNTVTNKRDITIDLSQFLEENRVTMEPRNPIEGKIFNNEDK